MANFDNPMGSGAAAGTKLPANTGRAARIGLWTLGVGLGGFFLWAGFAPLDEGVPAHGMVTIDTKSKPVQYLNGGIVKQVLVHEGSLVKEGQTLILFDEAAVRANYEAVRQHYLGYRAMQGRLEAEQTSTGQIRFHDDLKAESDDPLIRSQMRTQEQLLASRRASLRADLQAIEESVRGQEALQQAYAGMLDGRRRQNALIQDELTNTRNLVKEGYAPRNRQLELERSLAEGQTAMAELLGNTMRAQRAIAEMRQRALGRQQEYRKEVDTQLAEVMREVQADAEKLQAVKADLQRVEVKAPASGQVVGLAVQAPGSVVQSGQKLMDVVPEGEPLLLEARIAPHLIDKVHAGLLTDVRFTAFSHSPQLVVEGKVAYISSDLLQDQRSGESYYLARVAVTPEGMKKLGKRRMQPGMPAEVVIKTGERSLLTYMLNPLTKRMAASMKEE